jgi:hypothetical protein
VTDENFGGTYLPYMQGSRQEVAATTSNNLNNFLGLGQPGESAISESRNVRRHGSRRLRQPLCGADIQCHVPVVREAGLQAPGLSPVPTELLIPLDST